MPLREPGSSLWSLLGHRNTKKYCMYSAGLGASVYVVYTLYRKDYLAHLRRSIGKYTTAMDKGGDVLNRLLSDLYEFVMSDDREGEDERDVPESLRKVAKLVESREFRAATRSTVRAVVEGLVTVDDGEEDGEMSAERKTSALDKVLGALLSERGNTLVSLALSMAAKNIVSTYMESTREERMSGDSGPRIDEKLFAFLSNPRGQELAIRCISAFADSAMLAFAHETKEVNYYDQMLSTMVKPGHVDLVKECISLSIRAAVSAWNAPEEDACVMEEEVLAASPIPVMHDIDIKEDGDSPVSALRPPLSTIASPASSLSNGGTGCRSNAYATLRMRRSGAQGIATNQLRTNHNVGILRALSKEFVEVAKDEQGREAIARVAGSVTKEAVSAVANTIADRLDAAYFLSVMLLGVLLAVLANVVVRVVL